MKEKHECDWCGPDFEDAKYRFTITDLNGVVLDYCYLCGECSKRGVTFNGTIIDSAD